MVVASILVIDPDPQTSAAAVAALRGKPLEVVTARDGTEGLRLAVPRPPQLLLLEPRAAQPDCATLVRTLRTRPEFALMPVIYLAERESVGGWIRGFQIGSDDFLPKPLDPLELGLRIMIALKLRERAERSMRPKPRLGDDWSEVMTGFRGTLEEIGLPSLMTLVEMERKTGVLVLLMEGQQEKIRIYFQEGQVLQALSDQTPFPRNVELIYSLLIRTRGKFDFRPGPVDLRNEVNSQTTRLLLEGARRLDESRA